MIINIDDLNIHYIEEGTGETILLLHGWGSSVAPWRGIMSAFSDSYRLIALDFPGCGESDMPKVPWTVDDYARLVVKFLEALDIKNPILMGHSHGGRTVIKLVGSGVLNPKKIVLIDSAGLIAKKFFKQKFRARSFKLIKRTLTLPGIRKFSSGLLEKARAHYGSADYNAAPEVLRKTLVSLVNEDLSELLPKIKASSLLIWGENDTDTPVESGRKMEQLIPDAGLCVIKGAGHFSFVERPYEVNAILKSFLS